MKTGEGWFGLASSNEPFISIADEEIETRPINNYEKLVSAVISQALRDGCSQEYIVKNKGTIINHERADARRWFSDNDSSIKTFCAALNLNPEYVKTKASRLFTEYDARDSRPEKYCL